MLGTLRLIKRLSVEEASAGAAAVSSTAGAGASDAEHPTQAADRHANSANGTRFMNRLPSLGFLNFTLLYYRSGQGKWQ